MSRHRYFLETLLGLLVEEWGYDEVRRTLAAMSDQPRQVSRDQALRPPLRSKKPTAVEQINKINVTDRTLEKLLVIASKFDRKEFLPRVADVREFLAMMGEDVGFIKDRSDAFRRLVYALSKLSPEKLDDLANSSNYSGPAQLGPLSDAIKSAGESLRRNEQTNEFKHKT